MPNYTKIVELSAEEEDAYYVRLSADTRFLLSSLLNDLSAAPTKWFGWEDGADRDLTPEELDAADELTSRAFKEVITKKTMRAAGEIIAWGSNTLPDDALKCDGAAYLRADYPELFDVIGTTFGDGGGGSLYFNVPDLVEKYIMGAMPGMPEPLATELGVKLQTSVPEHKHAERVESNDAAYIGASGSTVKKVSGPQTSGTSLGRIYTDNAGVAGGVDQRPPTLCLHYIIFTGAV